MLHELELSHNLYLTEVRVKGAQILQSVSLIGNHALPSLDMSGYRKFRTLLCTDNDNLISLVFASCCALQFVTCKRNNAMTRSSLSGCESLEDLDLTVDSNAKLQLLHTLRCVMTA